MKTDDKSRQDMMRQHGSLERDEETNEAAWEAARGAVTGATKVCARAFLRSRYIYILALKASTKSVSGVLEIWKTRVEFGGG